MKVLKSSIGYLGLILLAILAVTTIFIACGGGSSDDSGGNGGGGTAEDQFPFKELSAPINSGSFLYGFINDDGYYYNFYGVKDSRNIPQYINKLVLAKSRAAGQSSLFLQIELDAHQRPIKITLPEMAGEIEIEYIDDTTANATVTGPDGVRETVVVNHPFQLQSQRSIDAQTPRGVISDLACDEITGAWIDKSIMVSGEIQGCDNGPQPFIEIVGGDPPKNYFADLDPSLIDPGHWYYYAHIDTEIPVTFEKWVTYCECNFGTNIVLTAVGANEIVDLVTAVGEGLGSFIQDIRNGTIGNSIKNTAGAVLSALTSGGTAQTLGELADFAASGGTLPCTKERYDLELNTISNDYDAYCDYGEENTQKIVFDPLTGEAPNFDWTKLCCNQETHAGGDAPEINAHFLGQTSGQFVFTYDTYSIKDQLIVMYEGNTLYDTGCVGTTGAVTLNYSGSVSKIVVDINPNCEVGTSGTAWKYTISCPQ